MSKNQFNNAEENQVKEKKARGKAGTPKGAAAGRSPAAKRQQSQGGNAKKAPAKNTSAKIRLQSRKTARRLCPSRKGTHIRESARQPIQHR